MRPRLYASQLPVAKTLAEIDWDALSDLERAQIVQIAHVTCWQDREDKLLLFVASGVGKTNLAAGNCRSLFTLDRSAHFY